MRISKKWLSQYMDISDLSMEEIADTITKAGFEVEGIEPMSQGTSLVIGEVLTCEDHPDSDHLHVTTVSTGDEVLQIVCGAPNVAAGQKVIVAKPGAKLPGGEIKSGKIRGVESNGMICALFELGVDKHMLSQEQLDGIEVLPADAPVGNQDPMAYLGLDDVVLDVSLTPNRADCLAAFNMAMEVGAILNREVKLPDYEGAANAGNDVETRMEVSSETPGCPQFLAKVIGSVKLGPSPKWMQELLRASGMHSINNIVDISNIVMLETGQPMHFYDIRAIQDQKIVVKQGFEEGYTALDGVEYQLQPEDLVITNQGKPIGIAGIMGGDDSKIEEDTSGLIIECASFNPVSIRNTARRLNLNTESSQRYQKGIEPLAAQKALDRAVQLLIEYADAKDIEKTVVFGSSGWQPKTITVKASEINRRLGTDFSNEQIVDVFERLHFAPVLEEDMLTVSVPSWRTDVEGMADLSEEVIRMLGYDNLPSTLPLMEMTEGKLDPKQKLTRKLRNALGALGVQDCVTYTLISAAKNEEAVLSCGEALEINPPLSEERRFIRTSILPSLMDAALYNKARNMSSVDLFEISDVTSKTAFRRHLAMVGYGNISESKWMDYEYPSDFYSLKGIIEEILESEGVASSRILFKEMENPGKIFHPYRSADVYVGKEKVGVFGEVHPMSRWGADLRHAVMAELDLDSILDLKKSKVKFTPISRYPAVQRDLAFVVNRDQNVGDIMELVRRSGKLGKENIVKNVDVFDVYTGEHVAEDEKSVALKMTFQSENQTLSDQEITKVFNEIIAAVEKKFNAKLRSA